MNDYEVNRIIRWKRGMRKANMMDKLLNIHAETGNLETPSTPGHVFIEASCLETARELILVLEEETEKLKRFAGAELIAVISKKEFLVEELSRKLDTLRQAIPADAVSSALKATLQGIEDSNEANRLFIQNSLSHWRDLLSILSPAGYGPAGETAARNSRPHKGLAFSREI